MPYKGPRPPRTTHDGGPPKVDGYNAYNRRDHYQPYVSPRQQGRRLCCDKAILSGADNRPPMLEKDMYDSWKSRMELYMMNRQHGRMILESVENDPLIWPSIEEN
ncbi:hypothetical protein Tco_0885710 [Tanacetum coccineum]